MLRIQRASALSPVRRVLFSGLVAVTLLGAACAPAAAPTPTTAPPKAPPPAPPAAPAAASPVAKPAGSPAASPSPSPSPSPGASPAASAAGAPKPSAGPPADWQQQWDRLVAAAKQEGKVVVFGPPNADTRAAISEAFKQRFGIEVEYNGATGSQVVSRLQNEATAGVLSGDVVLTGSDTMIRGLGASGQITNGAMGLLAPLRREFILPEVLDTTKYRNGKLWFADPTEQYIYRTSDYLEMIAAINTEYVQPSQLTSLNDLLKPEFKGKIAGGDPSTPSRGLALGSYLYATQGEEYIRNLYLGQEVFLSRDQRQLGDAIARGSYPIVLSLEAQEFDRLVGEGFKLAETTSLPTYTNAGFGLLGLLDKAPHPNAAKVFVNWIASAEGAKVFQEAQRHVSVRNDVDASSFHDYVVPKPNVQYFDSYDWGFTLGIRARSLETFQNLLNRR